MARLAPLVLNLNDGARSVLQELVNRHNTAQQIVLCAKIILLASIDFYNKLGFKEQATGLGKVIGKWLVN